MSAAATVAPGTRAVVLHTGQPRMGGQTGGRTGERAGGRTVGGRAGQKNGMFTKWYYLHAFGTHNEGSGACMFTKVYYLHASGRREPHHVHKSVFFTCNHGGGPIGNGGGSPIVDFGGGGMYIHKEQGWGQVSSSHATKCLAYSHPPTRKIRNIMHRISLNSS